LLKQAGSRSKFSENYNKKHDVRSRPSKRLRILEEQARRSLFLKMLQEDIPLETIALITGFAIGQLQALQGEL
jgi:hypothetical protein